MFSSTSGKKSFKEILNEFYELLTSSSPSEITKYWQEHHLLRAWFKGGQVNLGNYAKPDWSQLTLEDLICDCVLSLKAGAIVVYTELRKSHIIKECAARDEDVTSSINHSLINAGYDEIDLIVNKAYLERFIQAHNDHTKKGDRNIGKILLAYPQLFSNCVRYDLLEPHNIYEILFRLFSVNPSKASIMKWARDLEIDEVRFVNHLITKMNKDNAGKHFEILLLKMPGIAKQLFKACSLWQEFSIKELSSLLMFFSESDLVKDEDFFGFIFDSLQANMSERWSDLYKEMSSQSDLEINPVFEYVAYLVWLPKKNSYFNMFEVGLLEREEESVNRIFDACPRFLSEYVQDRQPNTENKCKMFEALLFLDVDNWLLREFVNVSSLRPVDFVNHILSSVSTNNFECFCNLLAENLLDIVKVMLASKDFQALLSSLPVSQLIGMYYDLAKSEAIKDSAIFDPLVSLLIDQTKETVLHIFNQLGAMNIPPDNLLLATFRKLTSVKKREREGGDLLPDCANREKRMVFFMGKENQPQQQNSVTSFPSYSAQKMH